MKGSLQQRAEGTWSLILYLGRDPITGKKKQKWHTFKGNKREAQKELNRLLAALEAGAVDPGKLSVAEYLRKWLKEYAAVNVTLKTYQGYEGIVEGHLAPAFGVTPLAKLSPLQIQAYYNRALESGRRDGKEGGLSPRTVGHHHRVLSEALGQAVRWQLLARNPADAVKPPTVKKSERPNLTVEETITVLRAVKDSGIHLPVLLAVSTGMRAGEILGLRWQDINFKAGVALISQSMENSRGAGTRFKLPKNNKKHPVEIPDLVLAYLLQVRREQARNRELMGEAYQDSDLIYTRGDGTPYRVDWLSKKFARFIVTQEVTQVSFHDLRHTQGALLILGGFHPKVVSERLGHSGIAITMDRYGHLMPGMDRAAAQYVNQLLEPLEEASLEQRAPETD